MDEGCDVMGQQEVYEFLNKHPDVWFSSKTIAENLGIGLQTTIQNLKRMRAHAEVDFRIVKVVRKSYRYKAREG